MNVKSAIAAAAVALIVGVAASTQAAAQVQERQVGPRTIRVSGVGEVRVQPDVATIQFAVETTGLTAQEAGQANAAAMDRVIAALVSAGVAREEVRTSGFSIYPEYTQPERGNEAEPPRIRGYRASNQVAVRSRDLDGLGRLIDVGLNAGANRMDGVYFEVEDAEQAQSDALRRAVEEARRSAETIAATLGLTLGPVLDASTSAEPIQPLYREVALQAMDFGRGGAAAPPTPIQPGQQTVRAVASVTYGIE